MFIENKVWKDLKSFKIDFKEYKFVKNPKGCEKYIKKLLKVFKKGNISDFKYSSFLVFGEQAYYKIEKDKVHVYTEDNKINFYINNNIRNYAINKNEMIIAQHKDIVDVETNKVVNKSMVIFYCKKITRGA